MLHAAASGTSCGTCGTNGGALLHEWQRRGATPLSRNLDGAVALHVAAQLKGITVAPPGQGQAAEAARKEKERKGEAVPQAPSLWESSSAEGLTEQIIAWHVEKGKLSGLDAKDRRGWTPLMVASRHQNGEVCKLLLNAKADANAQDNEGNTACHHTFELIDCMWILRILIRRGGADYKKLNHAGNPPQLPNEDGVGSMAEGCKAQ